MTRVHVVLPGGVDDPDRPSGGNHYDRRLCDELRTAGLTVVEHEVDGGWPAPTTDDLRRLARVVGSIPAGAIVLVDGLVGSAAASVLVPQADRVRLVVLVHLPLDDDAEGRVLRASHTVVTTSRWTRERLLTAYRLDPRRVRVAVPGTDPARLTEPSSHGGHLLAVGAVTPVKGHDVLVAALARLADLPWECRIVGSLDRDPGHAAAVRRSASGPALRGRVRLLGALPRPALEEVYATSDLLVLPSRLETYGMVATEALAHGIPVVATDVGGVREALGEADAPALLVPPEDPSSLASAVRAWLSDPDLRRVLRRRARGRRRSLPSWAQTAREVAAALSGQDGGEGPVGTGPAPTGEPASPPHRPRR